MFDIVYWTMKNGQKKSVDDMDINHLRNTLKMIIRNSTTKIVVKKEKPLGNIEACFAEAEMNQLYNDLMDLEDSEFY
jgi:hypothetical protein